MPLADQIERSDASRLAPLVRQPREDEDTSVRTSVEDENPEQFLPVEKLRTQYTDYLDTKVDEVQEQQDARRMYHGAHWTGDQIRILRLRHQPPMTWNRIARKINGIVGLVERSRSDPKALPRTPKSEQSAEIATQAIRYVLDSNQFKNIDPWCLLQCGIDGVAGVQMVLTQGDKGDPDIALPWVIGDEYFYDPKSYRLDFKDVRYEGIARWLDIGEAIELFPDKEDLLRSLIQGDADLTTNADREYKWIITASQRIRLVEHWYKHKGNWCWSFYCSSVIIDEGLSPWFDNKGKRISSFRMFSAAVDHDGDRYGFVRNLKGPQDALNQGKSKTMHIANSRRLILEKGAVDDVETARREWARPDGVIEVNPGKNVTPDPSTTDLQAFTAFTEDAKNELDQFANINLAAMSGPGITNISGRAIELLRQPGMAELGPFIFSYKSWKLELYRAIWNAVQRYWTAERWIRVANNEGLAQFIQLNGLSLDQFGRPAIVNAVGALDVDIILEEGPDIASMMQETYDLLKGYPPGTFPPQLIIEASSLPRSEKNRLLQIMQPKPQQQDPMMEVVKRLQVEAMAGKNAKTAAETHKTLAGADQAAAAAEEKRANIGKMGHEAHIDSSNLALDALRQAHDIYQAAQQPPPGTQPGGPQGGQAKPQGQPRPQQPQQPRPQQGAQPQGGGMMPPLPGARMARDGNHYISDPTRPGKYLRVA